MRKQSLGLFLIQLSLFLWICSFVGLVIWSSYSVTQLQGGENEATASEKAKLLLDKAVWRKRLSEWENARSDGCILQRDDGWIAIRPKRGLDTKQMRDALGDPGWIKRIVVREERGEGRPSVYTLHAYKGFVFVEWDITAKPGSIEVIFVHIPKDTKE